MKLKILAALAALPSVTAGPCDILAAGGSPCVAAHSLVRALYDAYSGPLYQVRRNVDNATLNVSALEAGGFANAAAQDAFCNASSFSLLSSSPPGLGSSSPLGLLPPFNSKVVLQPSQLPAFSWRHCDAQGFVTVTDSTNDDHHFTLVPALNGATDAVSFQSVNFPEWYISRVAGAEQGRTGIVKAPAAAAASWAVAPAYRRGAGSGPTEAAAAAAAAVVGVTLTWLGDGGVGSQLLTVGANLTGDCAGDYRPPAASVYLEEASSASSLSSSSGVSGAGAVWAVLPADAATACDVLRIFDQSPMGNHLDTAPPGGAAPHPDKPVAAGAFPVTIGAGAHKVYGGLFLGGMGYRIDDTRGVARGDEAETIYAVVSGKVFNEGCCFDYGNAEANNLDDGAGTMECVYFGTWDAARSGWCGGAGAGPWVMADLEDGLWACNESNAVNPLVVPQTSDFVVGMVKGDSSSAVATAVSASGPGHAAASGSGSGLWGIKAGDAAMGPLVKAWEGPRPPHYRPMKKQGSVLLGIGGDNSDSATGVWFEGVLTAGYTTDAVDDQLMREIVSVYGAGRQE
jgi:hypothetical protein